MPSGGRFLPDEIKEDGPTFLIRGVLRKGVKQERVYIQIAVGDLISEEKEIKEVRDMAVTYEEFMEAVSYINDLTEHRFGLGPIEDGGTARKRAVIAARSAAASERDLKKSADIAGKVIHAADIMQRYDSGGVSI